MSSDADWPWLAPDFFMFSSLHPTVSDHGDLLDDHDLFRQSPLPIA
jgi:hypothetical protein